MTAHERPLRQALWEQAIDDEDYQFAGELAAQDTDTAPPLSPRNKLSEEVIKRCVIDYLPTHKPTAPLHVTGHHSDVKL